MYKNLTIFNPTVDEGLNDDEEEYENFANFAMIMEMEEAVQNFNGDQNQTFEGLSWLQINSNYEVEGNEEISSKVDQQIFSSKDFRQKFKI